ncbi:hypothetical protein GGI12_003999 [Dipsacomyces acuminosporus]|nr:hypothetical protein GGI12_003999 [Dipsacomyces acuminosporus]
MASNDASLKNPLAIACPKPGCRCTILRANVAELVQRTPRTSLPGFGVEIAPTADSIPSQVKERIQGEGTDGWFWRLTNMMDFENVGFSKRVDGLQYLSCADCDLAPIGYHDTQDSVKEYLVAVDRIKYRE